MWIAAEPTAQTPTVGCSWPVVENCPDIQLPDGLDQNAIIDYATQAAIEVLWAATGRRYGICTRTIRPCLPECEGFPEVNAWDLVGNRGMGSPGFDPWFPLVAGTRCSRCPARCSCRTVEEVELWNRRIRSVDLVTVDGVVLGPRLWRRDGHRLIRLPGLPTRVDDFTDAAVVAGVSASLGDITVTGDVTDGGVVIGLEAGPHLVDLGAARSDGMLFLALAAGDTVTVPATVTKITGKATYESGVITATADTNVLLWLAQGTQTVTITPDQAVSLTAVQWSDLTAANPGWPRCQDRNVGPEDVGAWTVTYTYGRQVPVGGQLAAGILACEFAKSFGDANDCQLPQRIQTRVVDGQSIGFIDPMSFLDKGLTGLGGIVDHWISSVNPQRLTRRARAYRVDDPRRKRRR